MVRAFSSKELEAQQVSIRTPVAQRFGEAAYEALPEEEHLADLFVQGGCCMHKEPNAFEGGNTQMMAFRADAGLEPPFSS